MKKLLLFTFLAFANAMPAAESIKGENPYNWIVDHIRESPGQRITIVGGILSFGFEHSCLLRDINQKSSAISVTFDEDVLKADKDMISTWEAYQNLIVANSVNTKSEIFLLELSADVEIRPFPRLVTVNGETHEGGYGHMGFYPFGIVVKRIYGLKLLKIEKEPNQSPEPMPMSVTPPAAQASRQP